MVPRADAIEGIDQSILEWSENTADIAHLENILRLLHTMKGGARLTGLNSLGEFTHNFETDLMRLQASPTPLDDHFFTSVNERQDEITRRIGVFSRYAEGAALENKFWTFSCGVYYIGKSTKKNLPSF